MAPPTPKTPRASTSGRSRATPGPGVPRVVPAIPLALSRPNRNTRPITPEETDRAHSGSEHRDGRQPTVKRAVQERQSAAAPQGLLTPESRASDEMKNGLEEPVSSAAPADPSPKSDNHPEATSGEQSSVKSGEGSTEPPHSKAAPVAARQGLENGVALPKHELPPPFYPTDNLSTPTSTTSSAQLPFVPPNPAFHPQANTGSIMFGSYADSANVSPAPPISNGMMAYPSMAPPPGIINAGFGQPPFFPPGHAHNLSDSAPPPLYGPVAIPMANGYSLSREHTAPPIDGRAQPWLPTDGYNRVGPQPPFSPRRGPTLAQNVGNIPRSPSRASSRAQDGDTTRRFEKAEQWSQRPMANGVPTAHNAGSPERNAEAGLEEFISTFFCKPDFVDCVLEVTQGPNGPVILALPAHRILVARSPVIYSAMVAQGLISTSNAGPPVLRLPVLDKFLTPAALSGAIRCLYGGALPSAHELSHGLPPFRDESKNPEALKEPRARMDQALALAAAGYFLQMPAIINQALDLARSLMRWDNIERALTFAFDGSYGAFGHRLMGDIIEFIAHEFPTGFSLPGTVSERAVNPQSPVLIESRPSMHNRRLSCIKFGEVPLDETARPTFVTFVLSNILLSLPSSVLAALFHNWTLGNRLGWDKVADLMRSVVAEREAYRRSVLRSRNEYENGAKGDDEVNDRFRFEERIEPADYHPMGLQLVRYDMFRPAHGGH